MRGYSDNLVARLNRAQGDHFFFRNASAHGAYGGRHIVTMSRRLPWDVMTVVDSSRDSSGTDAAYGGERRYQVRVFIFWRELDASGTAREHVRVETVAYAHYRNGRDAYRHAVQVAATLDDAARPATSSTDYLDESEATSLARIVRRLDDEHVAAHGYAS